MGQTPTCCPFDVGIKERERERERENLSSSVSERRERRDDQMYECTVCIRAFVYRTGCRNSDEVYELIPLL